MIQVYSKNNCPYCTQAKNLLKSRGVAFEEINIEERPEAREFILAEGHRTMPQIYQDGKILVAGGYMGLAKQLPEFFETLKEAV
jgi:glutaredoxin-like protein NrdH